MNTQTAVPILYAIQARLFIEAKKIKTVLVVRRIREAEPLKKVSGVWNMDTWGEFAATKMIGASIVSNVGRRGTSR